MTENEWERQRIASIVSNIRRRIFEEIEPWIIDIQVSKNRLEKANTISIAESAKIESLKNLQNQFIATAEEIIVQFKNE